MRHSASLAVAGACAQITQQMKPRVMVAINPASGQDEAVLAQLNRGFGDAVDWDVVLTRPNSDRRVAERLRASNADLIAIYGGDGTVSRLVSALDDPAVPILVLPGGTANALAHEVGANIELEQLAARIARGEYRIRAFDTGRCRGRAVLLRVSIGLAAGLTHHADREQKDRFGPLAYLVSGLQAMREATPIRHLIDLDGRTEELDAVGVIVANSAAVGAGLPPIGDVDAHDAKLDVIVIPSTLRGLGKVLGNVAQAEQLLAGFPRWTARSVRIETAEPHAVHVDGEPCGETPVEIEARAAALRLVVFDLEA